MSVDVVMPRLSDSMDEGTLVRWLKQAGEQVAVGEEIAEIETDKATMPCEADVAGVLLELLVREGETVPLGTPIARIGAPGETVASAAPAAPAGAPVAAAASVAAPTATAEPAASSAAPMATAAPAAAPPAGAPGGAASSPARPPRAFASPLARRLAAEHGVDLLALTGTGPRGRIVKVDVLAAAARAATAPAAAAPLAAAPAPSPLAASGPRRTSTRESLSRLQEVIARRMVETKATQPEFVLRTEVEMDAVVALREQLRVAADGAGRPLPSYNDLVVRASALALREFPRANGAYRDGGFDLHERVNVGVAVAGTDSLTVPVVADADRKALGEIAHETRALAEAARAGSVTAAQLDGGTFTISNLGMFGVTSFDAVLHAGQAAILAVGALVRQPVERDGELALGHRMALSLTCDHRILYGADAAAFLARIRALLEQPLALAL